jgi:hypothetical protein
MGTDQRDLSVKGRKRRSSDKLIKSHFGDKAKVSLSLQAFTIYNHYN